MHILFAEKDPEYLIRKANLTTLGKPCVDKDVPFEYFLEQILAEHSTLDWVSLVIEDETRSDVVSQVVRHTKGNPRFAVESFRPDWTNKPRPKDPSATRKFLSKWPLRALQAAARERLCTKAMPETRQWFKQIKKTLSESRDDFKRAIALSLVPICIYRNGCPFKASCGLVNQVSSTKNISVRYLEYKAYVERSS